MSIISKSDIINYGYLIFSNIVVALFNWAQLSLITKTTSLTIVGIYTLALSISNPVFQFFNLQLRSVFVSDRNKKYNFNQYFSLRILCSLCSLLLCFIINIFFYINNYEYFIISFMISLLYLIDSLIDIFNARFHYEEMFLFVSLSNISRVVFSFLGIALGILFLRNYIIGFILAVIFKLFSLIFYDYLYLKSIKPIKINIDISKKLISLLRYSIPLGITVLIASLNINVSKYFVNIRFGIELQGAYSSIAYLYALGIFFIGSLGQIVMPKIANYYLLNKITYVKKIVYLYISFCFVVGIILYLISYYFGKQILLSFFSADIAVYSYLFSYIMLGAVFTFIQSGLGCCLTSVHIIKQQTYFSAIGLFVNFTVNILMIVFNNSIEYVPLANGISSLVQFILNLTYFNKKLSEK